MPEQEHGPHQRERDVDHSLQDARAVDLGRLVVLPGDSLQAREHQDHVVSRPPPGHEDGHRDLRPPFAVDPGDRLEVHEGHAVVDPADQVVEQSLLGAVEQAEDDGDNDHRGHARQEERSPVVRPEPQPGLVQEDGEYEGHDHHGRDVEDADHERVPERRPQDLVVEHGGEVAQPHPRLRGQPVPLHEAQVEREDQRVQAEDREQDEERRDEQIEVRMPPDVGPHGCPCLGSHAIRPRSWTATRARSRVRSDGGASVPASRRTPSCPCRWSPTCSAIAPSSGAPVPSPASDSAGGCG